MYQATERFPLVTADVTTRHGYSVWERRGFDQQWPEPDRLFLFYIRFNTDLTLKIDQYVYDMPAGRSINSAEKIVADAAAIGDPGKVPGLTLFSHGFNKVHFGWKPCYVTIVLDSPNLQFAPWPDNGLEETVVFRRNKVLVTDDRAEVIEYEPNYSFFNFERTTITVGNNERQAIRFVNFMRIDKEGTPLPPKNEALSWKYCMDAYIRIPLDTGEWLMVVFDPPHDNGGGDGPP